MNPMKNHLAPEPPWIALVLWCAAALVLAGCVYVGPDYREPRIEVPAAWNSPGVEGLSPRAPDKGMLERWWDAFGDRGLTFLVERALSGSLDLRMARARIREARALRDIERASLLPFLDASGSVTRSHGGTDGSSRSLYNAGLDASWEIDVFGGKRRSVEAAQAVLESSEEDFNAALVTLCGEIGLNYLDLRTYQARLRVAEANLVNQEQTYRLTRSRYEAGLSDALDLHQAKTTLENTRSGIPLLKRSITETMNRLAVLTGEAPGVLDGGLSGPGEVPRAPSSIAVGVPTDIIRRRPDIRRAERDLAAQSARVGVAASELYPKLFLDGSINLSAAHSSDLFSSGSKTTSWGPTLSMPLFHWGALRKGVEVQDARLEQTLVTYRSTVLAALEETENALTAYSQEIARNRSLVESEVAAKKAFEIASASYASGRTDFSRLLEAERTLLSIQDSLAQSDGAISSYLVRIYKVLGGGWDAGGAQAPAGPGRNRES
jgi:NodT family efflux transporter outer membrane factor (OMF) lipoprotein